MVNKYYDPGSERAAKVHSLFTTIAPRYDLINDLQSFGLHRWWKRRLCQLAQVRPTDQVLDLCCGTGDLAYRLGRTGARVVGLDFSEAMLKRARARGGSGEPSVQFICGDVLRLPLRDAQFDVVTISYGLRNLADLEAGFREMCRVTKPGGRLLILDFGKPPGRIWRTLYFAYLRHWVPVFGRLFCGDAQTHGYILESLERYPAQEGIAALMKKARCTGIRVVNLLGGIMSIHYGEKTEPSV